MAKRGRPKKNGVKQVWAVARAFLGLDGYDRSRKTGEKYSEALKASVAEVRQRFPGMPVSLTDIKRALAEFQPKAQPLGLTVTKPESSHTMIVDDIRFERILDLRIAPRPNYPRHNATDKPRKRRAKADLQPTES